MAERSTISQKVQLGVETTPGTAVAATKQLLALSLGLNVAEDVNTFQPKGGKYATVVYNGKEWTDVDVSGTATYSEIQYPLSSAITTPTTAQLMDAATPTGAYQWTWDPTSFGPDNPKTYTVEEGSSARAHRAANVIFTATGLTFDRKNVALKGDGIAAAIQDGIAMTSSGVTSIPTVPIKPTDISVFVDSASANLGNTKMLRVISGDWELTSRYKALFVVDSANPSFVATVESDPGSTFKLKMEADTLGMGLLSDFRLGSTKFIRFQATGPKIYSGATTPADVYSSYTLDVAGKISAVSKFEDSDGVYAIEYTFTVVHDATWGRAFLAKLVNTQATL